MRIVLCAPAHSFSTYDVFTGIHAGLESAGATVEPYPFDHTLAVLRALHHIGTEQAPDIAACVDPYAVATFGVIGFAVWKEADWLLAVNGEHLHFAALYTLRKAGIKTALLCTESPYTTSLRERYIASHYDVVFTNERKAPPLFNLNRRGTVHYLPHAYNPKVHRPDGPRVEMPPDVFFVGTAYDERKALFDGVDWRGLAFQVNGALWDGDTDAETILGRIMENAEAARYYRSAAISLNHHRLTGTYGDGSRIRPGDAESIGPRAYEIAACGGFQLCDDSRAELFDVFGASAATYKAGDSADLDRQIRYWLTHEARRMDYARAQHEAIQSHSWGARATQVLDILSQTRAGVSLHAITTKETPAWQPVMD